MSADKAVTPAQLDTVIKHDGEWSAHVRLAESRKGLFLFGEMPKALAKDDEASELTREYASAMFKRWMQLLNPTAEVVHVASGRYDGVLNPDGTIPDNVPMPLPSIKH